MKRGRKPDLPSVHVARGTSRPQRHGDTLEIVAPTALPQQPDWLTPAGKDVWLDEISRVSTTGLVVELDSTAFGNYCNLQGAINEAWKAAAVPPAAHLMEARKMAEQFGLFGGRSRLKGSGAGHGAAKTNPFAALGKR